MTHTPLHPGESDARSGATRSDPSPPAATPPAATPPAATPSAATPSAANLSAGGASAAGAAPRRGRVKRLAIVGGVLAVVAAGAGAYAVTHSDEKPAKTATVAPTTAAAVAPVGRSGAEGTFAFTVGASKCGVASVGPADLLQRATGQFCLVDVAVKNVGKEAVLLDSGSQHAVDTLGRQYPVSDRAAVFINDVSPTLLEEIKPGVTVRGVLPFDVPVGAALSSIVLHETVTSTGVTIPLS